MMYDLLAAVGAKVVINCRLVFVPATVLVLLQYPELKFVTFSSLTILLPCFAASVGGGEMQPARGSWYHVTVHQVL